MTKDIDEFKSYIRQLVDDFSAHEGQFSSIESAYRSLAEICMKINPRLSVELKYPIKMVQCEYLLPVLMELNSGIISSLKNRLFSVVESLSRIAIEHSVNFIYILDGKEHERSKSLLKHYVTESRRKATKWRIYAEKIRDEEALKFASIKLKYIDDICNTNEEFRDKRIKEWPDARQRFTDIGVEGLYHVLFASASDSVHSLSEDIFNLTLIENYPDGTKEEAIKSFYAEKISFAYYLAINSLLFFAEALARFGSSTEDSKTETEIREIGKELKQLIDAHEKLTSKYIRTG